MGIDLEARRYGNLEAFAISQAMKRFDTDYPSIEAREVVALITAYEEEDNIGAVLEKLPELVHGQPYHCLVVVDGGADKTAEIARAFSNVLVIDLPVNLGQGSALKVGYRFAIDYDAKYVITLDADGQNDPREMDGIVLPIIEDASDFVVASRRLGRDHTSDGFRRLGVKVFSFIMNRMTGQHLTDTSNGYRALRVTMLADVVDRRQQVQYQTAELLITCLKRGWRVSEVPTEWLPRASGTTKKGGNWTFGFRYARVVFGTWWRER